MKKVFRNAFAILALTSFVFTSCSDDETTSNNNTEQPGENPGSSDFTVKENDFKGTISKGTVTLDGTKTYQLTGSLIIGNGAKLIIPAGTRIIGTGGTSSYIAVAQGGKIEVNGTADKPVVMTGAQQTPGNWGGLVICGKAPINKGNTATAEVSELTYGGTDVNDNSGSIKYLRVEYAGANFNSEKEFNGLSLFGVGKGTTIEYVQLHEGSDDGIEFFGGTVDTKYIVSSHNEDDSFDWTEGWNGINEFWYAKQSSTAGNRGVEADNNSNNHVATPISNPKISNVTLVGRGNTGDEPQAFKLRVGTFADLNNIVISNWNVGFDVQHDESINAIGTSLKATNVRFINVNEKSKGKKTDNSSVDVSAIYTENNEATGAGNADQVPAWAQGWTTGL